MNKASSSKRLHDFLPQEHPVYPHPTDCQFFFTCFYGKEPNKFGCSNGQVIKRFFNRIDLGITQSGKGNVVSKYFLIIIVFAF
jgi:hypothetical protein